MADVETKTCQECGASVYPEHIQSQRAGVWGGKLYCIHCYGEHKTSQVTIDPGDFGSGSQTTDIPISKPVEDADDDLALEADVLDEPLPVEEPDVPIEKSEAAGGEIQIDGVSTGGKIKAFSGHMAAGHAELKFKRHLNHDGSGATRIKVFHSKLTDGALAYMQDQVNEWIDNNPDVEVKHASTQIGVVEGKHAEPHLIVTLFY